MRTIRIGAGAGYSGDRIEPAVELAEKGALDYLVFECLAERTIALAQQARMKDPAAGYDPLLAARMQAVLPICRANKVRIITNMGAANPLGAAEALHDQHGGRTDLARIASRGIEARLRPSEPGRIGLLPGRAREDGLRGGHVHPAERQGRKGSRNFPHTHDEIPRPDGNLPIVPAAQHCAPR